MNSLTTLEVFVSLCAQVTWMIAVAAYLTRRHGADSHADGCWAVLHISILLITAAAFFLPHLRLATWADFHPTSNYPAGNSVLYGLGWACGCIWAFGTLVVVIVGIAGMIKATVILHAAKSDKRLRKRMVDSIPALESVSTPIDIRLSDARFGAFCWQIHRPVIAVPHAVADFPVAEQAAILRHELAHLRRQHPLHLFLQRLVEAIYWFHPLVWWASRQAAAAREFRCDRDVVRSREDAAAYLRSMLRLIEMQFNGPSLLPSGLGFLGDASLLSRRANLLADSFDKPASPFPRWRAIRALGAALVVSTVIWFPVNPRASRRAEWSPWPGWTAQSLDAVGVPVRDYEIDGHRLDGHEHGE